MSSYPGATLRNILRTWSSSTATSSKPKTIAQNVDVVAYLAYLAFLQQLASESKAVAHANMGRGSKGRKIMLGKKSVRRAKKTVLRKMKA